MSSFNLQPSLFIAVSIFISRSRTLLMDPPMEPYGARFVPQSGSQPRHLWTLGGTSVFKIMNWQNQGYLDTVSSKYAWSMVGHMAAWMQIATEWWIPVIDRLCAPWTTCVLLKNVRLGMLEKDTMDIPVPSKSKTRRVQSPRHDPIPLRGYSKNRGFTMLYPHKSISDWG